MELGRAIGHIQVITYLISAVIQNTRHMRFSMPDPSGQILHSPCPWTLNVYSTVGAKGTIFNYIESQSAGFYLLGDGGGGGGGGGGGEGIETNLSVCRYKELLLP